ncbi:MAG: tetratricopeptide repeat protein [Elusimicrobia bacterium]|nr:tetratricopeptide repeat protein [Elusimicrobiota bacterium]
MSSSTDPAGRAPWETCLERGRREEKSGRMARAERAYLEALRANPNFNSLEREFARFLESRGRPKEAEPHLLRAMELGWPRDEGETALARLREKSSVPALIADQRFEEAARSLMSAEPGAPEGGDDLCPKVFSALLCARKYREAFILADAMLGKSSQIPLAHKSLWPWWSALSSRGSDAKSKFCVRELERLREAGAGGEFAGWFAYCRGVLLLNLNRNAEAMAEYERVKRLCPPRYSLLHYPFVLCLLGTGDFKGTIEAFQALLDKAPEYWWFRCRLGEAYMAGGDVARGLEEFARAENEVELYARQSILTWHGAALLWAGQYRRAVAKLDEAAGLGAGLWVNCWRGAAYLKLGRRRRALADLDAAIAADPQDLEAHLWRGEAHRLLGRSAEALRDLDRAIALDADYTWGYFNRALARGAAGDEKGLAADFAMIPDCVVAALRAPRAGAPGPKEMRAILEKGLERAGGIRRPEHFFNSIWMGRGKPAARRARG